VSLDEATTAAVPAPGAQLRFARERAGLSTDEVAAKLKLSVRQISAIEAGDWSALPERTFTRGFMRSYARLVGVNPDTLGLDRLNAQVGIVSELKPTPEGIGTIAHEGEQRASPARWLVPAALVAVLVAGGVYFQWGQHLGLPSFKIGNSTPAAGLKSAVAAKAEQQAAEKASASTSAPAPAAVTPPPAAEPAATASTAAAPSATPASAAPSLAPTPSALTLAPGEKRIALAFKGKSWTEVRSKGEVIFSETAQPGTREFAGAAPLSFIVGNASNVTVTIDGKNFDMTDITRNDVARFRIE